MASPSSTRFPENLPPVWYERLADEKNKDYFRALTGFLQNEYSQGQFVFPSKDRVLNALQTVDYPDVKVVILGQDPYHGVGQAIGLAFAVPNELRPKPPSLLNIFKELENDLGGEANPNHSDLSGWTKQGVLLLNTVLTVRKQQAFSHRDKGWETFTDKIIEDLGNREEPLVFILWGAAARKKKAMIRNHHGLIESPHPSPLSAHRGFLGSKPFSRTNEFLKDHGKEPIQWLKTSQ